MLEFFLLVSVRVSKVGFLTALTLPNMLFPCRDGLFMPVPFHHNENTREICTLCMSKYSNPGHLLLSLFCITCMQMPYTAEEDAKSQFLLDPKWDTSW